MEQGLNISITIPANMSMNERVNRKSMFGHQRLVTDIANPNQAAGECAQAIRHGQVITRPLRLTAPPIHASTVSDLSRTCDAFVRAFVGSLQSMRPVHCGAAAVRLGVRDEI